ncbi:hypothetical protein BC629DRAFT_852665 [Irpex lacteus]|nr:hypothetical protein BC629DRAFT_852665 [Irpex lacteus]
MSFFFLSLSPLLRSHSHYDNCAIHHQYIQHGIPGAVRVVIGFLGSGHFKLLPFYFFCLSLPPAFTLFPSAILVFTEGRGRQLAAHLKLFSVRCCCAYLSSASTTLPLLTHIPHLLRSARNLF